jgi:hypothetical protein
MATAGGLRHIAAQSRDERADRKSVSAGTSHAPLRIPLSKEQRMKPRAHGGLFAFVLLAACGTSSSTGGSTIDGGNPSGCPTATPAGDSACVGEGLQCTYGSCGELATCRAGAWNVVQEGCPPQEDPCAAAGGSCTCGPAPVGYVAASYACPPTPGPGCVQTCYRPATCGDAGACGAGETCCSVCNGSPFCAKTCPGVLCAPDAGPPRDATAD